MIYMLDPDFRRDVTDDDPYCCRCQRKLDLSRRKNPPVDVWVDWDTWRVSDVEGELEGPRVERGIMGADCFRSMKPYRKD